MSLSHRLASALRSAGVVSLSAGLRVARVWEPRLRRRLQAELTLDDAERLTALAYSWGRYWREPKVQRSGLRSFESAFVAASALDAGARWLVPAAGGGRELLALRGLGYAVAGTEPGPALRRSAQALLGPNVCLTPHTFSGLHDDPAAHRGPFDAVLAGWGAWGHVVRPQKRAAALTALWDRLRPGGHLCLSWPQDGGQPDATRLCIMPGGSVTVALSAEAVRAEAEGAGFEVTHVWEQGYPHVFLRRPGPG